MVAHGTCLLDICRRMARLDDTLLVIDDNIFIAAALNSVPTDENFIFAARFTPL